jgi:hypothetical protein
MLRERAFVAAIDTAAIIAVSAITAVAAAGSMS